jgi:hypothetical protein
MVDIKNKMRQNSMGGCPSQCTKGPTQIGKMGVMIPVKCWHWRDRYQCYSKGGDDGGFAWSYTRRMTSCDKKLRRQS